MKVSFEGFGENAVTFYNNQTAPAAAGKAVCMTANAEVGLCTEGRPAGIAISADDNYAVVQVKGFVLAQYTGETPAIGWCTLGGAEDGTVAVDSDGEAYLVVEVDEAAGTVGFIL